MSIYDPRDTFKVASNPISAASSIRPISKADIPPLVKRGGIFTVGGSGGEKLQAIFRRIETQKANLPDALYTK